MIILHQIKAVFVGLVLLFFALIPANILAMPFPLKRRLKMVQPVWQFFATNLLRYGCMVKFEINEDHRSPEFQQKPWFGLYVANHQSYIDIPTLFTKFQIPPIMKKEVLYIPLFGQCAWASGALAVSRSSEASRKRTFRVARQRMLGEHLALQYYPEGTRSKSSSPKPFEEIKKSLITFAYNEGIPVIPSSIYGTRGVLSSQGFINPGRHIGLIVHKEMWPKDFADADSFARAVWGKVISGHREMEAKLGPLN